MTDNGSIDPLAGLREMFAGEAEVINLTPAGRPQIGIPYAMAEVDDRGYHLICPACGHKSYDSDATAELGAGDRSTAEDAATKGASLAHGEHWQAEHEHDGHVSCTPEGCVIK